MKAEIRIESLNKTFKRWKSDTCSKRLPGEPDKMFTFEDEDDYWNALASIFLNHHWEKSFRKFPTFKNAIGDPFYSEPYEVICSLSEKLPNRFMDKSPSFFTEILKMIKPKMRWPWTYRFVDVMGTVGTTQNSSEYVVAIGLVQPMEQLAFLMSLSESPISLRIMDDGTLSLPQDGDVSKGNVSEFRFRLPESKESLHRLTELRNALAHEPEKVKIFTPRTYPGWESMHESYEEQSVWNLTKEKMEGLVCSFDSKSVPKEEKRFESTKVRMELPEGIRWDPMSFDKGRSVMASATMS